MEDSGILEKILILSVLSKAIFIQDGGDYGA
jgi:hypothetical protein